MVHFGRNYPGSLWAQLNNFVIFMPKGWTNDQMGSSNEDAEKWFKKNHPSIYEYMKSHEKDLKKRSDQGDYWWELRACDYYDVFEGAKISYLMFQVKPCFTYDKGGIYTNNAVWSFRLDDMFFLGLLNSKMGWFLISNYCTQIRGGYQTAYKYMSRVPIPDYTLEDQKLKKYHKKIEKLATSIIENNGNDRHKLMEEIDKTLYQYYNLTDEEIKFIEENARYDNFEDVEEELLESA